MIGAHRGPCDAGVLRCAQPPVTTAGLAARTRTLAATVLGSSLAFIDGTVVNVALPAIQRDLAAGAAETLWVMNAYLVMLGALVLMGGAAADRYGRRRVFIAGVFVFTAASLACALAPTSAALIAARTVQGVGAALLIPASLALLGATFPEKERSRAIGAWAGYGALAMAIGPVLGGWLTDAWSWRAVFYLNVPLAAAAVWLALRGAPDSRNAHAGALDWPGALLATLGLAGLTWGFTAAAEVGFRSVAVQTSLAIGAAAIALFLVVEARVRAPMLPLALFRSPTFSATNLLTLLLYFALSGALFFLPFELIRGRGYSATFAGAALLPMSVVMGIFSARAGALADRYGARLMLSAGPLVAALGFAMFAVVPPDKGYALSVFPAVLVVAIGMTITVAPLTSTVMAAVPRDYSGTASGVNNAIARVGGVLAVAVLGLLFPMEDATREAIFAGFKSVSLVAAACAAIGGAIVWLLLGRRAIVAGR